MKLFMWVMIVAIAFLLVHSSSPPKRPPSMLFYFHSTVLNETHPDANTAQVVAAPRSNLTVLGYGTMVVFDDPLTMDYSPDSTPVGRAQGFYVYDQLTKESVSAIFVFTALFNQEDGFNGTLNFVGADPVLSPYRDISVVGGTGDFELARGIARLSTQSISGVTFVLKVVVTLFYF
ncbi:hypothetical protein SELMODRAFT_115653 [Selaginella moellendorffii]|uniref:Dirigent protein n=1 Tax=Selaginella moellendorffii TaxID=88036 RepID=D8SEY4_SELML|nr:disease resistance response protein 206 [Selaginella moellendorffii]EFJ16946.1 hypothetical protein SELMODRAFT_115653 [Selaginella moellendorffii]|eukprot:XP_002981853.1 disease resistance response protein 206 [Selaginella moellendorffii]